MKHIKPISTLILGFLAIIVISNYPPPKPYIGDLSKTPDMLSLGEDIYEGFPLVNTLDREYECFLRAVYNEAYSEGIAGQQAVAQVLYNRYTSSKFPNDMCDIIHQRVGSVYQFPWIKNEYKKNLSLDQKIIEEMSEYLDTIYFGVYTVPKLEKATYFKRCDVKGGGWWRKLKMVAKIGDHCFYQSKSKT